MKKKILLTFFVASVLAVFFVSKQEKNNEEKSFIITPEGVLKQKNKPENARQLYSIEREKHEFNMQKNPITGEIPLEEQKREFNTS